MQNHLTIYLNVTAEDFYNWLVSYLNDGPCESFYNSMPPDCKLKWTPVKTQRRPHVEPNWWYYTVGLVEDWYERITVISAEDGALRFSFIQTRSNPYNPRAEITIGWDELFPGTAWKLLAALANAYPEAQPAIEIWANTSEGRQAGEVAATCEWWTKYVRVPNSELFYKIRMAGSSTQVGEFLEAYAQTEEGARLMQMTSLALDALPMESKEWILRMLDLWRHRYDIGRFLYGNSLTERREARAQAMEAYKRIAEWQLLTAGPPEAIPSFQQWAHEEGYIPAAPPREGSEGSIGVRQSSPGAPSNEQYDQAFTFIKSGEKTQAEAWKWYCEQTGIPANNSQVRHAFDQAIRRRLKGI